MKQLTFALFLLFISNSLIAQVFIRNGEYIVISAINERVLDVAHEKKDNGVNILVWDHTGNDNQVFNMNFDETGVFSLIAKHSNRSLSVLNNDTRDLSNIVQMDYTKSAGQLFKLEPVGRTDMFKIVNVTSDKALTVDPSSGNVILMSKIAEDGSNGNLNQYWRFSQRISFANTKSKRYLDVPNGSKESGVKLQIYDGNNGKTQAFDLISVANSEDYYIRSVASYKYLGLPEGRLTAGIQVEQQDFTGATSQRFQLEGVADYTYKIVPSGSNLALDIRFQDTKNGSAIVLDAQQPTSSQNWIMYDYNPQRKSDNAKQLKKEIKDAGKAAGSKVVDTGAKAVEKTKEIGKKAKDKLKKLFK
ncbi:MAG: RICIN domain-containing protein [Ignavibacteriaceae bacterium]|nr:RICIN domain-containing protein [Ignavibacteriaceae bacterium]